MRRLWPSLLEVSGNVGFLGLTPSLSRTCPVGSATVVPVGYGRLASESESGPGPGLALSQAAGSSSVQLIECAFRPQAAAAAGALPV